MSLGDVPRFGDLEWIHRRGPVKVPKLRIRTKKKQRQRYFPIWQRMEGQWKRYYCQDCHSVSFVVVETQGAFVRVGCAVGHYVTLAMPIAREKPETEEAR